MASRGQAIVKLDDDDGTRAASREQGPRSSMTRMIWRSFAPISPLVARRRLR
jgi:hypothetical protein